MLRHCVMFRWNDDVTDETKAAVGAGLDPMSRLDGVVAYHHGPDLGISDGNWDYVVVGDFVDVDAFEAYGSDPDHLAVIADLIRPNIAARAAVQMDL